MKMSDEQLCNNARRAASELVDRLENELESAKRKADRSAKDAADAEKHTMDYGSAASGCTTIGCLGILLAMVGSCSASCNRSDDPGNAILTITGLICFAILAFAFYTNRRPKRTYAQAGEDARSQNTIETDLEDAKLLKKRIDQVCAELKYAQGSSEKAILRQRLEMLSDEARNY